MRTIGNGLVGWLVDVAHFGMWVQGKMKLEGRALVAFLVLVGLWALFWRLLLYLAVR